MKNLITLSHSGKQHSYHVARGLLRLGVLEKFYTSSYIESEFLQKKLRNHSFFQRRFIDGLGGESVESNWRFEVPEHVVRYITRDANKARDAIYNRDQRFDSYMAKKISRLESSAFWGFQGSCHSTLKAANDSGKYSICELATGHVTSAKKILEEEAQLHPEWAHTIDNFVFPSWYEKRLEEEPHLARRVVAASSFTKKTLLDDGIEENQISVLPLGFDTDHIHFDKRTDPKKKGPLKLLYAGRITQRKGIKYLLEAMNGFNKSDVELHLIGNLNSADEVLKSYSDNYIYHAPLSQHQLFSEYKNYDALVLPTVFEGFGLVIVEAMAAGLPVITTSHSIGPEIIKEGDNGFLVPIRDVSSLVKSIERLADKSPEERVVMRHAAHAAATAFTWKAYDKRLKELINTIDFES